MPLQALSVRVVFLFMPPKPIELIHSQAVEFIQSFCRAGQSEASLHSSAIY
jgi:hypothetical protein